MLKVVPDPSPLLTYPRTNALGNKILIFQCKCRRNTVNFICHVFSSTEELGFVSLNLDGRTNQCLENQAGESHSGEEHVLLLQRTQVWFPVSTCRLTTSRASDAFSCLHEHHVPVQYPYRQMQTKCTRKQK